MTTATRRRRKAYDPAAIDLAEVSKLSVEDLARLRVEEPDYFAAIEAANTRFLLADAKVNQLLYYRPLNDDARRLHLSTAFEFGIQGGNKSGKTGTALAEAAIQMTGIVPLAFRECVTCQRTMIERNGAWTHEAYDDRHDAALLYPVVKLRAPIRARLVVTSLVSAWDTNLKLKLQWWEWNGKLRDGLPGDPDLGHWGLIPRRMLINGDWNQSWSEKHRVATLTNGSKLFVMSHDQNIDDFNQGAFHLILEDEIPPENIHRANRIRAMELGGRLITGGTPPDDRAGSVSVVWFYDQVLAPGLDGSNPDENDAVALWTENNRTLDERDIDRVAKGLTPEEREARLHGKAIHLHGLIFPGFTEKPRVWCFRCNEASAASATVCSKCGGSELEGYCHVWNDGDLDWPGPTTWPLLFYMDPHQSRPTACKWIKIDPDDGWWQVAEREIAGDAQAVKDEVQRVEHDLLAQRPVWRKGDPKITAQTNQFAQEFQGRKFTIREAFEEVGFAFDEANTNFTVGRQRVIDALKPQPYTRRPRYRVHATCTRSIYQITHFVWDKDRPARANSDFPALDRYLAMDDPTYRQCDWARNPQPIVATANAVGRNARTGW